MVKVRQFELSELDAFLSIRREALATNPEAFGDSVAKFDARDPAIDRERFERNFSVGAFDGDRCIAMTGMFRNSEPGFRHRGTIWGVFVSPEYRGQKLGEQMFAFIFESAKHFNWLSEIVLSVKTANESAIAVYERAGMDRFIPADNDPVFSSPCANETHMRWINVR